MLIQEGTSWRKIRLAVLKLLENHKPKSSFDSANTGKCGYQTDSGQSGLWKVQVT